MWIAGEGNGNIFHGFAYVWQSQGGLRGFLHVSTDLALAKSSNNLISEQAASRLLTNRQCDEQDGMLKLLATESRRNTRRWVLQALAACNSQKAIPLFRESLKSDDTMIAYVGAQSLGMLRAREAIPELEATVAKGVPQVSGMAAWALSMIGETQTSRAWAIKVLSAPRRHPDPRAEDFAQRGQAGSVLERVGLPEDIPLLEQNKGPLGVYLDYQKKAILARQAQKEAAPQ